MSKAFKTLKEIELDLVVKSGLIQQLKLKVDELEQKLKEKQDKIDKAKEYIEYCYVKGRTKNAKSYNLGLYEILTDKSLFNFTRKEVEQYFSKELRKK